MRPEIAAILLFSLFVVCYLWGKFKPDIQITRTKQVYFFYTWKYRRKGFYLFTL